jgi:NADPH-dependent F420 reductase
MKIAVLGGTGRMGRALARQLARRNQVVIGSRDPARAKETAKMIEGATGADYSSACRAADATAFAIPYSAIGTAKTLIGELSGKLVLSLINPLVIKDGLLAFPLKEGSAAEELARLLPRSRVATAFNHVSSLFLEKEEVKPIDVLVAADSKEAYEEAGGIVKSIPNLRPLYVGPLSQARVVEMMTPLVLNLASLNRTGSLTTKFVSVEESE